MVLFLPDLAGSSDAIGLAAHEGGGYRAAPTVARGLPIPITQVLANLEFKALNEIILFLGLAALVAVAAKRLRIPYTVGLVIMGLAVGFLDLEISRAIPIQDLGQGLIFLLFLPPLLFEGSMNIQFKDLRESAPLAISMAIFGTLLSTLFVGTAAFYLARSLGWDVSWEVALLLGVIVSPTDPVSVLALFKEQGVEKRLSTLVEGESLFNDGVAVVLYLLLYQAVDLGQPLDLAEGLGTFVWMVGIGAVIGISLGVLMNWVLSLLDDHLVEVLISLVVAWGSYILAEYFHASGVIATVSAGLLLGNLGRRTSMSPTTRVSLNLVWEMIAFLANSLVFLLMGLAMDVTLLLEYWWPIIAIFGVTLIARSLITFSLGGIDVSIRKRFPPSWLHVLNWGGLKGTIPIALVLGLHHSLELGVGGLDQKLTQIVFGVVLLSLTIQGLTIKTLLKRLGLSGTPPGGPEYERQHALVLVHGEACRAVEQLAKTGEIPAESARQLVDEYTARRQQAEGRVRELLAANPELQAMRLEDARRQALYSQRAVLEEVFQKGVISEETLAEVRAEIDADFDLRH